MMSAVAYEYSHGLAYYRRFIGTLHLFIDVIEDLLGAGASGMCVHHGDVDSE